MEKKFTPKKKRIVKKTKNKNDNLLNNFKNCLDEGPSVYSLVASNIALLLLLWVDAEFTKYALPIVFAQLTGYFITRFFEDKVLVYLLMGILMLAFSIHFFIPILIY